MLRELRIRNFAVIDEAEIEFGDGLIVLSGETGAGKSILVEALGLLVGGRASSDLVRSDRDRAVVEGRFDIGSVPGLADCFDEWGVDPDGEWLIVRRELRSEGRNRAWVNGSPATTRVLRDIGSYLVDLHGQHEHQRLLSRGEQRILLDAFGGAEGDAAQVEAAFTRRGEIERELEEIKRLAAAGRERADYLGFKAEEIEAAGLEEGEEDRLDAEARRLTHAEELLELSDRLYAELYDAEGSVVDRLGELGRALAELIRIDPDSAEFEELRETAVRSAEELGRRLGEYRTRIEHDPTRLEHVRARLDEIYRLKRKYGDSVEDIILAGREARRELGAIEDSEERIARLAGEHAAADAELVSAAARLSGVRRAAGRELEAAVSRTTPELGLGSGRFHVVLEALPETGARGAERVEFLVSLNEGLDPGPLARVASGGEMSRLMLALKTVLIAVDPVPVLVFDEVDAGIGGEVAHRVADRLARLTEGHQVLVVTHLAQIAARASSHLSVDKTVESSAGVRRTRTVVRRLEGSDRVRELARMLGGDPDSEVSRTHAQELLAVRPGPGSGRPSAPAGRGTASD